MPFLVICEKHGPCALIIPNNLCYAKINSMITNLPTDPFMLMSYINQQLRDNYPSLEELCKSLDIDENTLKANLKSVGFEYNPDANKFW